MLLKMDRFALQKGVPTLKFFFFTLSFKRNVYLPPPSAFVSVPIRVHASLLLLLTLLLLLLFIGYVYVPERCGESGRQCRLHVSFHGCGANTDSVGFTFIENSGILEAALAQDVVVLFPQVGKNCLYVTKYRFSVS